MRKTLQTSFWRGALQSLPENVRAYYLADIERAERLDETIDAIVELFVKARNWAVGLFDGAKPHSAH